MKICKYCNNPGYTDKRGGQYSICHKCRSNKISKANTGKKVSKEIKKKMSESHKGQIPWMKGRKHSFESRKKISESHKGQIPWNKGKINVYSEDILKRMSNSHKNNIPWNKGNKGIYSKETLKNMSINHVGKISPNKGNIYSKEVRKKISDSGMGREPPNKGKSWEEFLGEDRAKEVKMKIRQAQIKHLKKIFPDKNNIWGNIGKYETQILDEIEKEKGIKIERQYEIIGYFLDGYDPINNVAYEVDETFHKKQKEKDLRRQKEIEEYIGCVFERIQI